jgi:glutamate/aspartate transport system substrate-binding protein
MKGIVTAILFFSFFITSLSAQELPGTLEQIKASGKIKVGYRQFSPPMSFLGEDGIPAGYSIDLCKEIVSEIQKKIGRTIKIEYIPVTAEERFPVLVNKKIDLLCGATTKTLSRSEIVDFTQIIFVTGASFMTKAGNDIRGNFAGKKIGVVKNTTTAIELKKLFKETQIDTNIVFLGSTLEGRNALEKEKIDAFAADQIVLIGLALNSDDPGKFSILPDLFSYEPLALAVRKNDADFRLVADRVISGLCRSKQMLRIYDKWFSEFSSIRPSAFEALVELNSLSE